MNKIYNNQKEITTEILKFFKKVCPNMRKTQLNILPSILYGILKSKSLVASKITEELKGDFCNIQNDSNIKRIRRLFKNRYFNPYELYDQIIRYVINESKCLFKNNRLIVVFDHMFSHDNYTVFMITLKLGKQGIPLWFRCFRHKEDKAFKTEMIKEGISYVSSLFPKDFKLIFLADRWFNATSILEHINSLNRTYVVRLKGNLRTSIFDKRKKQYVDCSLSDIYHLKDRSKNFFEAPLTENGFKTNIVIGRSDGTDSPWILATNSDNTQITVQDYSKRFGGIETVFKNQKSNGFYLEKTCNASLKYFESMYFCACFGILYLSILGADYTKNPNCYKNVKITVYYNSKGKKIRKKSLFNVGYTIFKLALDNSYQKIRLPFNLILYYI